MPPFETTVAVVAALAGAVASVAGFGIGSLLTPLVGIGVGLRLAVAIVSIPHLAGTLLRFVMMRKHLDLRVLLRFGLMSAAGGLIGAALNAYAGSAALSLLLGLLLVFAGGMGLSGLSKRWRFGRREAWVAGALSGTLGGLVGNQGGIRSAALLAFPIEKDAFVATATAIGLLVDGARMPVYVVTQGTQIAEQWRLVLVATAGVVAGTIGGRRLLAAVPEPVFRKIVASIILMLGLSMVAEFGAKLVAPHF